MAWNPRASCCGLARRGVKWQHRVNLDRSPHGSLAARRERRRYWTAMILTAFSLALLAQLVRVYVPLAFELGEDIGGTTGYLAAGAVALAVFASPAIGGIGGMAGLGRVALVSGVVMIAAARLAIQLVHPIPIWLGTVALVIGLVALPSVVAAVRRAGGDTA